MSSRIINLPLPSTLYLPLSEKSEKKPRLRVSVGDKIKRGQLIMSDEDAVVYSPVAGTVGEIICTVLARPVGGEVFALTLKTAANDGGEIIPLSANRDSPQAFLKAAGILGLGGGAFLAWKKWRGGLHALVVNAVEGDDNISCDRALLFERGDSLSAAIGRVGKFLRVEKNYLALSDKMPSLPGDKNLIPHRFAADYALGNEKLLLQKLFGGNWLSPPSDYGVICFNVATVLAIDDALTKSLPLTHRVITVRKENGEVINARAPFGLPVADLARFLNCSPKHCRAGGHWAATVLPPLAVACAAGNMLDFCAPAESVAMPCIRCGACDVACPVFLSPQNLQASAADGKLEKMTKEKIWDCLECRRCDKVCPSHIPLTKIFAAAKRQLSATQTERETAKKWRDKYEKHLQRQTAATTATVNINDIVADAIRRATLKNENADQNPPQG